MIPNPTTTLPPNPPSPEPDPFSLMSKGVVLGDMNDADELSTSPEQERLTQEAQLLANELTTVPFCPWTPNPGPQTMFLLDFGREALFGGAAGGGKSIAILMAASQFLSVPGYSALLLRRTFPDLDRPGALMDIAEQWWRGRSDVRFDTRAKTYIFDCPGGGHSRIGFGSLDTEDDRFKYQGGAYAFIGFDELTQFRERDYLYLFSRLRKTNHGPMARIPLRMRCTANPGGVSHEFVFRRFVAPWKGWKDGNEERPARNFHPAVISDNPKLDEADYVESLNNLDPVTRAQLLRGDWNIRPDGRMFKREWFRPISRSELPGNCRWVRFWDMASTDPAPGGDPDYTVGALVGRSPEGGYYIADVKRWRKEPAESETLLHRVSVADTRNVLEAMEQEGGAAGKIMIHHYRTGAFAGSNFRGVPSSGKSKGGTSIFTSAKTSQGKIIAAGPVASQADARNVFIVVDGNWDHEAFLSEMEIFPDSNHDDQCLVGDTQLITSTGVMALRDVRAGMKVWGASGWVEVLDSAQTGIKPVLQRAGLIGTANHPVWTQRGWTPLVTVSTHDMVLSCNAKATGARTKSLEWPLGSVCGVTTPISVSRPGGFRRITTTTVPLRDARPSARSTSVGSAASTTRVGSSTATLSRQSARHAERSGSSRSFSTASPTVDILTPSKTATVATIDRELQTSSAGSKHFIRKCGSSTTGRSLTAGTFTTWTRTRPTTLSPTSNACLPPTTPRSTPSSAASGVHPPSRSKSWTVPASRRPNGIALLPGRNGTASTGSSNVESSVGLSRPLVSGSPVALTSLKRSHGRSAPRGSVPVFNLTTSDGTYYANGILVHNCDAISGAFALLAKMHMYGLDFGQASTGLTHDYQWRPDAMPSSTLARDDGWMGGRIVEEREMMRRMEQEMREERMAVEGAFSME